MARQNDATTAEAASMEAKEPYAQTKENDHEETGRREDDEDHEIFKSRTDGVQFRTVGWPMASIIFLKRESLSFTPSCAVQIRLCPRTKWAKEKKELTLRLCARQSCLRQVS